MKKSTATHDCLASAHAASSVTIAAQAKVHNIYALSQKMKYTLIIALLFTAGCATSRLDTHIRERSAVFNRGDFGMPMIGYGDSVECENIGYYSVGYRTKNVDGKAFAAKRIYDCCSAVINDAEYFLSVPKNGRIWVLENIRPPI